MKKGFMEFVATNLVPDFPGYTARWYAEQYLELDPNGSDAEQPVQSLANTLSKQVLEGREKRIRRERVGGVYRFFSTSEVSKEHSENIVAQISLSAKDLEDIDNLVALEKYKNRNDVIQWLVRESIEVNRGLFGKAADTRKQIDMLKRSI